MYHVVASHAQAPLSPDRIFKASAAANQAAAQYGREKIIDATIGVFASDTTNVACLPTVEAVFRSLPMSEICSYAPIIGLPDYLDAAIALTFADNQPTAYIKAVATAGGSGAIHNAVWNYSEIGDTVLTSDWHWEGYNVICEAILRRLDMFALFDDENHFNVEAFSAKMKALLTRQKSLIVILNTPAHNPTGYSLTGAEWEQVLEVCRQSAQDAAKRLILLIDIAYIDYSGEKNSCRAFMRQLHDLPENVMTILAFSMSKSFTLYGQRTGAMIGLSASKAGIDEFEHVNQYSARGTWSNVNRGCMKLLALIYQNKALLAQVEAERKHYYELLIERARLFVAEAAGVGLSILPYVAGFFLIIPADDPEAVHRRLQDDHIFTVPLTKGIRFAICSVPTPQIAGMATKIERSLRAAPAGTASDLGALPIAQ